MAIFKTFYLATQQKVKNFDEHCLGAVQVILDIFVITDEFEVESSSNIRIRLNSRVEFIILLSEKCEIWPHSH